MNLCCQARRSKFAQRPDGIIVTVNCICGKFIAAHLFDKMPMAQHWSKFKLTFMREEQPA